MLVKSLALVAALGSVAVAEHQKVVWMTSTDYVTKKHMKTVTHCDESSPAPPPKSEPCEEPPASDLIPISTYYTTAVNVETSTRVVATSTFTTVVTQTTVVPVSTYYTTQTAQVDSVTTSLVTDVETETEVVPVSTYYTTESDTTSPVSTQLSTATETSTEVGIASVKAEVEEVETEPVSTASSTKTTEISTTQTSTIETTETSTETTSSAVSTESSEVPTSEVPTSTEQTTSSAPETTSSAPETTTSEAPTTSSSSTPTPSVPCPMPLSECDESEELQYHCAGNGIIRCVRDHQGNGDKPGAFPGAPLRWQWAPCKDKGAQCVENNGAKPKCVLGLEPDQGTCPKSQPTQEIPKCGNEGDQCGFPDAWTFQCVGNRIISCGAGYVTNNTDVWSGDFERFYHLCPKGNCAYDQDGWPRCDPDATTKVDCPAGFA